MNNEEFFTFLDFEGIGINCLYCTFNLNFSWSVSNALNFDAHN
jgi:hypothetical protein